MPKRKQPQEPQKQKPIDKPKDFAERQATGKELRKTVPRSSHAGWQPAPDRPDPIDLLQQEDKTRLQFLLPIKYGRMVASPFAFLRGSAVVMAARSGDDADGRVGRRTLWGCPSCQLRHLRNARTQRGLRHQ